MLAQQFVKEYKLFVLFKETIKKKKCISGWHVMHRLGSKEVHKKDLKECWKKSFYSNLRNQQNTGEILKWGQYSCVGTDGSFIISQIKAQYLWTGKTWISSKLSKVKNQEELCSNGGKKQRSTAQTHC